jgi:hypothetical protein
VIEILDACQVQTVGREVVSLGDGRAHEQALILARSPSMLFLTRLDVASFVERMPPLSPMIVETNRSRCSGVTSSLQARASRSRNTSKFSRVPLTAALASSMRVVDVLRVAEGEVGTEALALGLARATVLAQTWRIVPLRTRRLAEPSCDHDRQPKGSTGESSPGRTIGSSSFSVSAQSGRRRA